MSNVVSKVVVVGSLHYDVVMDAPDRPRKDETVTGRSWQPKCGGKGGNQAVAAVQGGATTRMIGAVGRDHFGEALLMNLDQADVDRTGVAILDCAVSGMSVAIFDDEGDYGAVIVSGSNLTIAAEQCGDIQLQGIDVLVLQNEISEATNHAAASAARREGVTTILNAAPARVFVTDLPVLVDILVAYADRLGREYVVPSIPVVVASTHGAGDMFVGTLAAQLAGGATMLAGIEAANNAAGKLVSTPENKR